MTLAWMLKALPGFMSVVLHGVELLARPKLTNPLQTAELTQCRDVDQLVAWNPLMLEQ